MKILYRYILRQILVVFFVCLVVFTFILFIGNMLRIVEMMAKGVGMGIILRFLLLLVPFMFSYSIPISVLTSVLLVFARLSADNEITAMRASGINLKHIFKPVLLYTLIMVSLCYIINDKLRPNAIFVGRKLLLEIGVEEPIFNITSGRFNEVFPNYVICVGQKKGKVLKRVVVYKFEEDKLNSIVTAENGEFVYQTKKSTTEPEQKERVSKTKKRENTYLKLYKGVIEEIPKVEQETGKVNRMEFDTYIIEFNLDEQMHDISKLIKKEREMTNKELLYRINNLNDKLFHDNYKQLFPKLEQEISSIKTRIHNRIAMALSGLVFVLVGIPLGINVHRSETSIGIGVSLILVSFYYFLMTLGESFQFKINYYPWLLMWIPNLILFIIGSVLVFKLLKK